MSVIEVNLSDKNIKPVIRDFTDEELQQREIDLIEHQRVSKEVEINIIKQNIKDLDIKWIRALREGGTRPDGELYLDYYNRLITEERLRLDELSV